MSSPFAADRRFLGRVALLSLAYVGAMFATKQLIDGGQVTGWPAYGLAVLPGLLLAATFLAIGRMIVEEQDEYRRMLLVRQTLIAAGFTLSLVTIWGHLEVFGFVPQFEGLYIAVLWAIGLVIGSAYNFLKLAPAAE